MKPKDNRGNRTTAKEDLMHPKNGNHLNKKTRYNLLIKDFRIKIIIIIVTESI